jgi:hypothetical protein
MPGATTISPVAPAVTSKAPGAVLGVTAVVEQINAGTDTLAPLVLRFAQVGHVGLSGLTGGGSIGSSSRPFMPTR